MIGENCVKPDTAKGDSVAHRGVGSHLPHMMAAKETKYTMLIMHHILDTYLIFREIIH